MIYFSGCWFSLVYGKKWIPGYDSGPEYRLVYDWSRVLSGEELTADSELYSSRQNRTQIAHETVIIG
jgi:hypothetical protein